MNKKGSVVIAVICGIAIAAVFAAVLILVYFRNEYKVRVTFYDIKDVTVGSPLKYRGLKIGSVSEIETGLDDKITLVLKVDSDYTGYLREKALFTINREFFSNKPPEVLLGYCNNDKFENLAKLESGSEIMGEENKYFFGVKTRAGCLGNIPNALQGLVRGMGDIVDSLEIKQLYGEINKFVQDMSKLGHEQMQEFISEKGPHIRKQVELLIKELEQGGYKDKAKEWKEFLEQELGFRNFSAALKDLTREAGDFLRSPEMRQLYGELGKFAEDVSRLGYEEAQKFINEKGPHIRRQIEQLIKELEQSGYKERAKRWKEFLARELNFTDFSTALMELTNEVGSFLNSPELKKLYGDLGKLAEDMSKLGHEQMQKIIKENGPRIRKQIEQLIKELEQSGYDERAKRWKEFLAQEFGLKD